MKKYLKLRLEAQNFSEKLVFPSWKEIEQHDETKFQLILLQVSIAVDMHYGIEELERGD